jgi:hypothetical protein
LAYYPPLFVLSAISNHSGQLFFFFIGWGMDVLH